MRIGKVFKFEAAHRLEGWPEDHPCHRLHGHSYVVEIEVSGPIDLSRGAVVDFARITEAWKYFHNRFDHQNLNEVLVMQNVTAENLVDHIVEHLPSFLPGNVTLRRVKLWETTTGYAEVQLND